MTLAPSVPTAAAPTPALQDKNAAPLNQLDVLLEETYEQLMALAQQVLVLAQRQLVQQAGCASTRQPWKLSPCKHVLQQLVPEGRA